MEPYCNMNSSNGRNYRNAMNQGGKACSNPRGGADNRAGARPCPDRQNQMMQDRSGRSMEVECVCQSKMKRNCHQNDPMERLGEQFPLVMAYVPWQQWGDLYDAECGLMQGTIFKDLNFIFCGVRC